MSKSVKHSRIYGPIKEQKEGRVRERERKNEKREVVVVEGGAACSRPDHSFLLTDAGPRGESWERKGGGSGWRKGGKFGQEVLG